MARQRGTATRYVYEVDRLIDDLGTGQLGGTTSQEDWDGIQGHCPAKYPTFKTKAAADNFIIRKRIIARVQRYALNADGSKGYTAGAGPVIDARPVGERGKGLTHWQSPRRRRR